MNPVDGAVDDTAGKCLQVSQTAFLKACRAKESCRNRPLCRNSYHGTVEHINHLQVFQSG